MATTMALEARVDALEATLEIYRLEARYSRTWDLGLADEWADVYTEDGSFERIDVEGVPGLAIAGRDALRGFCETLNARANYLHMMHSHEIAVDGDAASATIFFECRRASTGDHPVRGLTTGYYEVSYVRTGAGWRIRRRRERHVFREESAFYGLV
jgi:SnoaL-like protein